MANDYQGIIYLCDHCGEKKTSNTLHCKFCSTSKQRKEQDEENEKIRIKLKEKYE